MYTGVIGLQLCRRMTKRGMHTLLYIVGNFEGGGDFRGFCRSAWYRVTTLKKFTPTIAGFA